MLQIGSKNPRAHWNFCKNMPARNLEENAGTMIGRGNMCNFSVAAHYMSHRESD